MDENIKIINELLAKHGRESVFTREKMKMETKIFKDFPSLRKELMQILKNPAEGFWETFSDFIPVLDKKVESLPEEPVLEADLWDKKVSVTIRRTGREWVLNQYTLGEGEEYLQREQHYLVASSIVAKGITSTNYKIIYKMDENGIPEYRAIASFFTGFKGE